MIYIRRLFDSLEVWRKARLEVLRLVQPQAGEAALPAGAVL